MLKIRLMRIGTKKRPYYRVVVVDERAKRTGAYIELLGTFNPLTEPKEIKIDKARIEHWINMGAQPSVGYLRMIGKAPQRAPRKPKKEKKAEEPAPAAAAATEAAPEAEETKDEATVEAESTPVAEVEAPATEPEPEVKPEEEAPMPDASAVGSTESASGQTKSAPEAASADSSGEPKEKKDEGSA